MSSQDSKDDTFSLEISSNQNIDFCIWTLQVDGLHVFPFDHHQDGNSCLRDLGLNAEDWEDWFFKVSALQDYRLRKCSSNREVKKRLEQKLDFRRKSWRRARILSLFRMPRFDEASERRKLESQLAKSPQQYREVSKKIHPFNRHSLPPEVWNPSSCVGDKIWELWDDYSFSERYRRRQQSKASFNSVEHESFFDQVDAYSHVVPYLQIIHVNYSKPITIVFPSGIAVTSRFINFPGSADNYQHILEMVKSICNSDDQSPRFLW